MLKHEKQVLALQLKYVMLCLAYLLFTACNDKQILQKPLEFNNTAELFRLLEKLKKTLPTQNYQQLTDAIGYLKTMDTEHISIETFYQSLAGLSIEQIISKSHSIKSNAIRSP